ncbi:hypothetical protein [Arthrobacter pityocampae]|uniref:hypothetical protein n=1 Tax=Arthrobacter pityocampae TaxID=547334 RepID=UPI0011AFFFF9|nr:hypothetical protein [Arthrobacter pityocampae]
MLGVLTVLAGSTVIGASSTRPEEPRQKAAWRTVQRPQGYELAAHTQASITVAVTTDDNGTAEAIRVTYSIDGEQYVAETTTTIELSVTPCF